MIYLVAKKVPQIIDVVDENPGGSQKVFSKIDKFISSLPMEKFDFVLSHALEKMIRKFKLYVMKLDNQLTQHLRKYKSKTAASAESLKKLSLFEKESETNQAEEEKFDVEIQNEAEQPGKENEDENM